MALAATADTAEVVEAAVGSARGAVEAVAKFAAEAGGSDGAGKYDGYCGEAFAAVGVAWAADATGGQLGGAERLLAGWRTAGWDLWGREGVAVVAERTRPETTMETGSDRP